jgi:hypothetical protein
MRERVEKVFAFIEELIGTLPISPRHRELLRVPLDVSREQAEVSPDLPAIQLPLLVHAAITGDETPAVPLLSSPSPACKNKERRWRSSGHWPTSLQRPCWR